MNVPPGEAKALTLWEYNALLTNWNKSHAVEEEVEPMPVEEFMEMEQYFLDHPELLN